MNEEAGFLAEIRQNPAEETARLAYADWLDEQGDPNNTAKADFLRLTARMLDPERPKGDDKQLQKLAAGLDPAWLAVVSRLKVERCRRQTTEGQVQAVRREFAFLCEQSWDEMTPTGDDTTRRCEKCRENVHYCDTIVVAREHARQGHCVAVDLGIIRREGDLAPQRAMLRGRISVQQMQRLRAASRVDKVSRERERCKKG